MINVFTAILKVKNRAFGSLIIKSALERVFTSSLKGRNGVTISSLQMREGVFTSYLKSRNGVFATSLTTLFIALGLITADSSLRIDSSIITVDNV